MKELNYEKLPYVSDEHIEMLREVFKDSVRNVESTEELYFVKGQQAVIDFLNTVRINQEESGE